MTGEKEAGMFGIIIGLIAFGSIVTGVMCIMVDSVRREEAQQKASDEYARQKQEKVAV
jgi:hypothetical protein